MTGIESWLPNPQCVREEARSMPQADTHLRNEVARLTADVTYWHDRAIQAEAVIARRDASVFTATGRRPRRGVQYGSLTE